MSSSNLKSFDAATVCTYGRLLCMFPNVCIAVYDLLLLQKVT